MSLSRSAPPRSIRPHTGLSEVDQAAWAAYARLVRPLPGRSVPVSPPDCEIASPAPAATRQPAGSPAGGARAIAVPTPAGLTIGDSPGGLDAASWQRFRAGRLPAARRLDLHGFTVQRAFLAVTHFVRVAHADHVRCVEIVTGRGEGEGGVLRRELPLWLNLPDLRPLVLAAVYPHPANQGAVRLLLRRLR